MNWSNSLPLLTLLTSLVPAAIIALMREQQVRARTLVNLSGATLKLVLIGVMLWGVFHNQRYEFRYSLLPELDLVLRADALAMFFVTLSGLLWFVTTIYAISYLEGSPHRRRFFGFFSLCVSATVGIALSGNLLTFVVFYEFLTLSTYPLVVHRETETSLRAGRVYLAYTLGGGAALLLGAVWLHTLVPAVEFDGGASLAAVGAEHYGTLRFLFAVIVAGLGVKAALIPLHGWLPQAMVAPAPVSALLHAVAVVKAGAFGIVRLVYDVYGIDLTQELGLNLPLVALASATIVYGSMRALRQDGLKQRLAYSTVSQVSYVTLGVALVGPSATIGGVVHLVHQGLMKITLFFCAGNLAETLGIHKVSEMHGVGRRMPWTMAAFTLGAFGMMGVPPMAGFISKWYLGAGAIEASQTWVLLVLAASTALNAAYFLPILYIAWFCEPNGEWTAKPSPRGAETKWGLLLPPLATASAALAVGLGAGIPFSPLQWASLIVERNYGFAAPNPGWIADPVLPNFRVSPLLITIVVPLALSVMLLGSKRRRWAQSLASLAAAPGLALACFGETGSSVDVPWILLQLHLGLDGTARIFLLFTSLLWLLAGVYARGYMADDPRAQGFWRYFLLTMAGNLGLVLASDMASFYLFFAIMSFSSYGMIVHARTPDAFRAGRVYMVLVVVGEVVLFMGILMATGARGSLLYDDGGIQLAKSPFLYLTACLFLVGLGIKAGILPLHVWLPLAHPAAPTPASAVLSGAMIKAGLLGWLRFLPWGDAALPEWGNVVLMLGLVTAFYGVAIGVAQSNPKTVLAYSSISQMGLLTLGVGAGLLVPQSWAAIAPAVMIYAFHHGLAKGCLFLSVGVAHHARGNSWRCRLWQAGLIFPALVMVGVPLTMGAVSKTSLKYALGSLPQPWTSAIEGAISVATVGTALLMARFLFVLWPRGEQPHAPSASTMVSAWLILLLAVAGGVWIIPPPFQMENAWDAMTATIAWSNIWPMLLAGAIAWSAIWISKTFFKLRLPSIPAGDLLVPLMRGAHALRGRWPTLAAISQRSRCVFITAGNTCRRPAWGRMIQSAEAGISTWPGVGIAMLITALAYLLLGFRNS